MRLSPDMDRAVRQLLESVHRSGVTHLDMSDDRRAEWASRAQHPTTPVATAMPTAHEGPPAPGPAPANKTAESADRTGPANDRLSQLRLVQADVAACIRCQELASGRTQTVFGVGDPHARLVFLGEAPGADEDARGEPFVGRAGQLLTDIITKGMKLRREDVYILNVLKCRPPNNRNPAPDEVINCRGFLDRQLDIIRPEFICCLGSIAAKTLLNTEVSIGKLRGKFHEYRGIPVLCTYHPAYLLRNPSAKREVWADIQVLMQRMELPSGEKPRID